MWRWFLFGDRSGQWPRVRKEHLLDNPTCAVCGTLKKLEVHHIVPYKVDPSMELEPSNLITLCRRDHLLFGHLDDWKRYNKSVIVDAEYWHRKLT